MKNFKEAFGCNLHSIRKGNKLTIEALAEMVDLSPRQITRIESGANFPSSETLCKLSIALKVNLKNLFDVDWYDDQMYYSHGKFLKPNIRVIKEDNNKSIVKSLTLLTDKNIEIKEILPHENVPSFLLDFSKKYKLNLIVEVFEKKERDNIVKILPNGQIETIIKKENLKSKKDYNENPDYEYILKKLREFSTDKNKLSYLKASIDAIGNKEALKNLKSIIKGIELTL